MAFIKRPDVSGRVVFLADYDMLMAEHLVRGIDVWINTPRRPWEASGTSGMKVLVNGGLNLSELDGWWAEAYAPDVGWAIGDGKDRGEDPSWDAVEADMLYERLERDIVPEFYTRDEQGIPRPWVQRIRRTMTRLTRAFSADRAVREYVERYYLPAAAAYRERVADRGRIGAQVLAWRRMLEKSWATASFGALEVDSHDDRHVFRVRVDLGGLDPDGIEVQLYADGLDGQLPVREPMRRADAAPETNTFLYTAEVRATRPQWHFTPRLVARRPGASVPLEAPFILWTEHRR